MGDALRFSGERFRAVYHIAGERADAEAQARDICLEQTVEYPQDLVRRADIRDQIFGRVISFDEIGAGRCAAVVDYAVEIAGLELTQLLNVLFGNISLKPGIRLVSFELPGSLLAAFRGPRFGQEGLRDLLGVAERPLLCTAIKPMGLSPAELADLAYRMAKGGIDLIKDDHGLADQPFCPFDERVARTAEAVAKANRETGRRCLYLPNVTARFDEVMRRARFAKDAGAGGLVISPGLAGLDTMRAMADDDGLRLPVVSHPALQGSFTVHASAGMAHGAIFGQVNRLAGADAAIFPSFGGRFSFTEAECRDAVDGMVRPMGRVRPIFPIPAGGMTLARVPELLRFFGDDVVLLIGGDLHRTPDLTAACRDFASLVEDCSARARS